MASRSAVGELDATAPGDAGHRGGVRLAGTGSPAAGPGSSRDSTRLDGGPARQVTKLLRDAPRSGSDAASG